MTWILTLRKRTNAGRDTAPQYATFRTEPFRTRRAAREYLAEYVESNGLRVLSAVPSRHGVLLSGDGTARFSYGISKGAGAR